MSTNEEEVDGVRTNLRPARGPLKCTFRSMCDCIVVAWNQNDDCFCLAICGKVERKVGSRRAL
jgi:hypothetical protein